MATQGSSAAVTEALRHLTAVEASIKNLTTELDSDGRIMDNDPLVLELVRLPGSPYSTARQPTTTMLVKEFCNRRCILTSAGLLLIASGTFFILFFPIIFTDILHEELKLRPNSRGYDAWVSPPFPLAMDVYFFNWTNPEDITNHSTKPILEELGPYRFIEHPTKVDIQWHDANSTVSFRKKSIYYFDEEGSNGSLDDMISTINIVAVSAASKAKYWGYLKQKGVSMGFTLYDQQINVVKTAGELLFDGYEDNMVLMGKHMFQDVEIPFDRVGWFYTRNNSADLIGHYNMHTGVDDITKLGSMAEWNYKPRTDFFEDGCGMLNGSAGELYPPGLSKEQPVELFTPDMCRTLPLDFEEEVTVHGVKAYKYSGAERAVDNGTLFPETACFSSGEIVPSGVLNISSCRFGTPVFVSFPHYYGADPYYLDQVEGLSPSKEKHQFFMSLEPTTSVPLDVAARLQLNIMIEPYENVGIFSGVKRVFLPVLWFEQHVIMPPELSGEIAFALTIPSIVRVSGIVMCVCGIAMLFWIPLERMIFRGRRVVAIGNKPPPSGAFNGVHAFTNGAEKGLLHATEKNGKPLTTLLLEKPEKQPLPECVGDRRAEAECFPLIDGKSATIVKS
ncbi:scavenger receptor class B, croquemort type [Anopheles darlingi]|uniref:Scavenger receptor class B, croquemort type n=1 Tax=Anopheles darlingi TaxID=43151 RepID=W5JF85_ANODA|nr:scavenger receptor class B, croquemort type [Anopheles darlingi]